MSAVEREIKFGRMMDQLRACFPSMVNITDANWLTMCEAYFQMLESYSDPVLVVTFRTAAKGGGRGGFFPDVGRLVEIATPLQTTADRPRHQIAAQSPTRRSLSDDHPAEKLARSLEAGTIKPRAAAAKVAELVAEIGGDGLGPAGSGLGPPPDERDFCGKCGWLKVNHGLLGGCSERYGSEYERE